MGKSLLVAALCRIYARRGLRVAPFKAQNMSNNAAVCADGAEIGRAQAVQAHAAGIAPNADMNPVLLKPEADSRSQVIVLGRAWQTLPAGSFYRRKDASGPSSPTPSPGAGPVRSDHVIEARQSVELNLQATDIVNMAVARHASCPVLLAATSTGGIFPQLLGRSACSAADERAPSCGLIVNRFRGDPALFVDGVRILEARGVPVLGVVPYLPALAIPEEDAVALETREKAASGGTDIAVIQLPRIANFDDFDPLRTEPSVRLRFVQTVAELGRPHAVILPGTKSTLADLAWLRTQGLAEAIARLAAEGTAIVGICGGYQMLGRVIRDPHRVESEVTHAEGLGLLEIETTFARTKATYQAQARVLGPLSGVGTGSSRSRMNRCTAMRSTWGRRSASPWLEILQRSGETGASPRRRREQRRRIWGCYLHGLFGNPGFRRSWLASLGHASEAGRTAFEASINRLAERPTWATLDMRQLEQGSSGSSFHEAKVQAASRAAAGSKSVSRTARCTRSTSMAAMCSRRRSVR